jgi:hypothetical protein
VTALKRREYFNRSAADDVISEVLERLFRLLGSYTHMRLSCHVEQADCRIVYVVRRGMSCRAKDPK